MAKKYPTVAHVLSAYYKLPLKRLQALMALGVIPHESDLLIDIDDPASLYDDSATVALLESVRPQFDTALDPFRTCLTIEAGELIHNGVPATFPHDRMLVAFTSFDCGASDRFYPVTKHNMPWHGHRVAVSRAELVAAGYPELYAQWGYDSDAFAAVPVDGRLLLGTLSWAHDANPWPKCEVPRGKFLQRLADVLECRSGGAK